MKQKDLIIQFRDVVQNATPNDVDVRVRGGDQDAEPPEAIIDWQIEGLSDANGHSPFGGARTDSNGNVVGKELHQYYRIELQTTIRMYDELSKDSVAMGLVSKFADFEYDSDLFDPDTRLWQTPELLPSDNAVFDPDWYESTVTTSCQFVHRTDGEDVETLERIDVNPVNEEPDETSTNIID